MADQTLQQTIEKELCAILNRTRPMMLRSLASLALIDRRHVACAITTTDGQVVIIDKAARLGIVCGVAYSVLHNFRPLDKNIVFIEGQQRSMTGKGISGATSKEKCISLSRGP